MVQTGAGDKKILRLVEQIKIEDMQVKSFGYFWLQGIENMNTPLLSPFVVSALQNMAKNNKQEIQNFRDRFFSDIIAKSIES